MEGVRGCFVLSAKKISMKNKNRTSPEQRSEAIAMRAAGYTVPAIADRLGISSRTLHRLFSASDTRRGEIKTELLDAARARLVESITSHEKLIEEAGRLLADDLAHARLLRERLGEAIPHLRASTLEEVVQVTRAAAAYSTALKNTSDMLRRSIRVDKAIDEKGDFSLPELVVREWESDSCSPEAPAEDSNREVVDRNDADEVTEGGDHLADL
jgi:AcrR family transcriptional regulator